MIRVQKAEDSQKRRWQDYGSIKEEVVKVLLEHPEGMTGAKIAELVDITQGAMSKYLSMMRVALNCSVIVNVFWPFVCA